MCQLLWYKCLSSNAPITTITVEIIAIFNLEMLNVEVDEAVVVEANSNPFVGTTATVVFEVVEVGGTPSY